MTLSPAVILVDLEHPRVRALRAWLPPIVHDDAFDSPALSAHGRRTLEALRARVDGVFSTVALHPSARPGVREHLLRAAVVGDLSSRERTHHITIGVDVLEASPAEAWTMVLALSTTLWAMRRRGADDLRRGRVDDAERTLEDTIDDGADSDPGPKAQAGARPW